jgi:hypothetical protein
LNHRKQIYSWLKIPKPEGQYRKQGGLEVEADAGLVGLELLHDLGECGTGLEDEARGTGNGEVEPRAPVERDTEELPRQVE